MKPADRVLPRLYRVRSTGPGKWIACCPAHDDRHPSMSIREIDDGTLLLRCFGGCDVDQIVSALGIELSDLFPPRPKAGGGRKPERRPWSAADLIALAAHEAGIALIVVSDTVTGKPVNEDDLHRLAVAGGRLADMVEACNGRRG